MAGKNEVGSGETGDDGMAAIKVKRDRGSNTVYAAVSSDDYHVVEGSRQAVTWDQQKTAHDASNDGDIVNLNVDATFSGATITTESGGGDALAGWAVDVTSGEDAVEGDDVPEALDADGMASFTATVGVDDLPASYTFAVDADQTVQGRRGQRAGRRRELQTGPMSTTTHTGLKLAATMEAGLIEVRYTTQTLIAYVHHERDQVKGYTGNILGGDARMSEMIDVSLRYIDDSGRSRAFTSADSVDMDEGTGANAGVYTFSNVPADERVIVQAEEDADAVGIMLLDKGEHSDELSTYREHAKRTA